MTPTHPTHPTTSTATPHAQADAQAHARARTRPLTPRGFTLIELLVVIVIIGVLISVTLAIAGGVISGGRANLTRETLRQVDLAIDGLLSQSRGPLPFLIETPNPNPASNQTALLPLLDGVSLDDPAGPVQINSIGLFAQHLENAGLASLLAGVPESQVTTLDGDRLRINTALPVTAPGRQPELRTIRDGWGNPIRFVHPKFQGIITAGQVSGDDLTDQANFVPLFTDMPSDTSNELLQFGDFPAAFRDPTMPTRLDTTTTPPRLPIVNVRRNTTTDSDGGFTVGGRPYVYSAGPSNNPADREDNVYTIEPRFP